MSSQTNYILLPDGRIQRQYIETNEPFGLNNDLAKRLAQNAVVPFRDNGWPKGVRVGLGMDGKRYIAVTLDSIRIATYFGPAQDPGTQELYITPTWERTLASAETSRVWTPPQDMKLVLVASHVPDIGGAPTLYLVLYDLNAGFRVPFFPNIFDDSRVCPGPWVDREWAEKSKLSVPEIAAWLADGINHSLWNTDLWAGAKTRIAPLFLRWSAEPGSEVQLAPAANHAALEPLIIPSNNAVNWLGGVTL